MAFFIHLSSLSSPLLLMLSPKIFAFIPILPMCLSSRNRSIYKAFHHIMPYSDSLCKVLHYSKTGVPWQMNKTLIINFSYLKMPCNAGFCKVLSTFLCIVFFLLITTLFAKYFKMVQLGAMCSSQIVVS